MSNEQSDQIIVLPDAQTLAQAAADYFVQSAQRHIVATGRFVVALSGGSTPKAMFALLAQSPYAEAVNWAQVYFFWGDERCVPPDHRDSNYRMTHETLLSKVPVPPAHIYRMQGELDPAAAAAAYAAQMKTFFQSDELPRFDLVFLGMGADGHTASLFPHTSALTVDGKRLVVENYIEKFDAFRITLTADVLNNAKEIVFLIGGGDKAEAFKAVYAGSYQPDLYPSQLIQPVAGTLCWLIDEAAFAAMKNEVC